MKNDFEIARNFKRSDWIELKDKLQDDMDNSANWEKAYNLFKARVEYRYLNPIEKLREFDENSFSGEGFAVMTILCSLIEFLESLYQGKNYKYLKNGRERLGLYEYNKSSEIFKSFLENREPFKSKFPKELVDKFYSDVRCGLLHEAETRGKWRIRVDTFDLIKEEDGAVILNRDIFLQYIKDYIKGYKQVLLKDQERKKAFIRKFDHIAQV